MEKSVVLNHLKHFIKSKTNEETGKIKTKTLSALSKITESDIHFGSPPECFFAYIEANATGVGESSFQGTTTQRTVSRDFVTEEYLFIDGHIGAALKGFKIFPQMTRQATRYYKKSEIVKIAKRYGYDLHSQYFSDLNFYIRDYRLNRYSVKLTQPPFKLPIQPIYSVSSKKRTAASALTIGYIYRINGTEHVIIEPQDQTKSGDQNSGFGCAPWMFLGLIFPPILLLALFVLYIKDKNEQMFG